MSGFIEFELSDHESEDEPEVTRFEVLGISGREVVDVLGDEEGGFFSYIEDVEVGRGPRNGTIDQGATGTKDWAAATWSLSSCEIEDRRGFIDQTVAKIQELYGWTLEEVE